MEFDDWRLLIEGWGLETSRRAVLASGAATSARPEPVTSWRNASGTAGENQIEGGMVAVGRKGVAAGNAGVKVGADTGRLTARQAARMRLPASMQRHRALLFPNKCL